VTDRIHGTLIRYDANRHFGWLERDDGGRDLWIAEGAFRTADIVPIEGHRYVFSVVYDDQHRPRAAEVLYEGAARAARQIFNPVRP